MKPAIPPLDLTIVALELLAKARRLDHEMPTSDAGGGITTSRAAHLLAHAWRQAVIEQYDEVRALQTGDSKRLLDRAYSMCEGAMRLRGIEMGNAPICHHIESAIVESIHGSHWPVVDAMMGMARPAWVHWIDAARESLADEEAAIATSQLLGAVHHLIEERGIASGIGPAAAMFSVARRNGDCQESPMDDAERATHSLRNAIADMLAMRGIRDVDGPPDAFFEVLKPDGIEVERFTYVAIKPEGLAMPTFQTAAEAAAFAYGTLWRYTEGKEGIVWRERLVVDHDNDPADPHRAIRWGAYWRAVTVPRDVVAMAGKIAALRSGS
jgi:hypothetical protein